MAEIADRKTVKMKVQKIGLLLAVVSTLCCVNAAFGHPDVALHGEVALGWSNDQIGKAVADYGTGAATAPRVQMVDGKKCVVSTNIHLDVRNEFAFDIDETVQLELLFKLGPQTTKAKVTYDASDSAPATREFELPAGGSEGSWHKTVISLDHARLAGLGRYGSDLSIEQNWWSPQIKPFTVCGIKLTRSYSTVVPQAYGRLALEVLDGNNGSTAARVGLYDQAGRLPLPEQEAVPVKYGDVSRRISVESHEGGGVQWPSKNKTAFFVDGQYNARLPVGTYDLVVSKGPEYRVLLQKVTVQKNKTTEINVRLQRWVDMPSKGWYSGDPHIHYERDSPYDDKVLLGLTRAEDVHVASILQWGTTSRTYMPQYEMAAVPSELESSYLLKTGQEDPRTSKRGHTLHLNLKEFVRNPSEYMLYHQVLEKTRAQGAVTGYAHVLDGEFAAGTRTGLALDVPFNLIDIVEVLPGGAGGQTWFDFLNLGYRLIPSAGSDCCMALPGGVLPGSVRSYVRIEGPFSAQAWFDGLKRGETFVTNGPLLDFSVNGQKMGAVLKLKSGEPVSIKAHAFINPDVDCLERLELIEQGEVVKSEIPKAGAEELNLGLITKARHGTWYVLRAYGSPPPKSDSPFPPGRTVALSAPIFIEVDGQTFWKPSAVPSIVARMKTDLQKVLVSPRENPDPDEPWDRAEPDMATWDVQKVFLEQKVAQATALYDKLSSRAAEDEAKRK